MENLVRDVRFAFRTIHKRRAFAATIVLIFALGTGANTAIFSLVHTILIEPLPYAQPDRLVRLWEIDLSSPKDLRMTSVSNLKDWRQRNRTLEGIAAWRRPASTTLTGRVPAEEIHAAFVTANFFSLLKTDAFLGRTFYPEEDVVRHEVAVVSHGFWKSHLGGRADAVEDVIEMDQESYRIVGVLPEDFKSPAGKADVWIPILLEANQIDRGQNYLQALARMKQGISFKQAQADMDAVAAALEKEYTASNSRHGVALMPMQKQITAPIRTPLMILFAMVTLVLLIACSNISNLLIVRGFDRQREFTVRMALGATRAHLIRQMLTENMLLFLTGGATGIIVAQWMLRSLLFLEPGMLPDLYRIGIETESFAFTLAVTLVTGFLFGSAPGIQFRRVELAAALKEGERSTTGNALTTALRSLFVVAQITLSLALIISAALLVRSFIAMRHLAAGFNADQVLVTQQALDGVKYLEPASKSMYYRNLIDRLKTISGVRDAAAATVIPMGQFGIDFQVPYSREDQAQPEIAVAPRAYFRAVTTEYFRTLQIPLLQGRYFSQDDDDSAPLAVIVNESLAKKTWPGETAVGKRLRFFWADWRIYNVVGVTSNTLSYGATSGFVAELYVPDSQIPYSVMNVVIRFDRLSAGSAGQIKKAFIEIDPLQPIQDITAMKSLIDQSVHHERFVAFLAGAFAALAVFLALAGIYGTFSFFVVRRTREIGLRIALGATRPQVRKWILRKGVALIVPGIISGLVCALGITAWLKNFLFGIHAVDFLTFALSAAILCLAAILACFIPACRASSLDPNLALRYE